MVDWESLNLVTWFGLGVVLQALILARGKMDLVQLLALLLISLVVGFRGSTLREVVLWYFATFAYFFGVIFRKTILAKVEEETVFFFTLLLWVTVGLSDLELWHKFVLLGTILVPSVGVLLIAVRRLHLTPRHRLLLYVWYLVVSSLIVILTVLGGQVAFLVDGTNSSGQSPLTAFFAGMSFLVLAVNFWYVVLLIPRDRTAGSSEDRQEHEDDMVGSFLERESSLRRVLVLSLFVLVVFVANQVYALIDRELVVSLLMILYTNRNLPSGFKDVLT